MSAASPRRNIRVQACTNCSRAKAKCVWPGIEGPAPETCQRFGLAIDHTKVLERKLDDIMSLLNRDREHSARNSQTSDSHPSPSINLHSTTTQHQSDGSYSPLNSTATPVELLQGILTIIPGYRVTLQEANVILQLYMSDMVPQFPFVPLSVCDAQELYKDKPLLLKTVIWTLMHLARGLAEDLGLTKRPDLSTSTSQSIVENAAHLRDDLGSRSFHTNAGRRAVLGLFYINSVLGSILGRASRLDFARYFDDCCGDLSNDNELPTDSLLVHLIKARKIALKVDDVFGERTDFQSGRPFGGFHAMVIANVQKELETFVKSLPTPLRSNYLLNEHCMAIRIRLFEPAIHANGTHGFKSPHLRSRIMWRCFTSTQELLHAFLSLSVDTYPTLTFISILHLALAIIKAAGLLSVVDHDWDLDTARANLDLADTLQILSDRFITSPRATGYGSTILSSRQRMVSAYAENYFGIRSWYLCKIGSTATPDAVPMMMDPAFLQDSGMTEGFDFWQHLSGLSYGNLPNV
ncbi:hypothetical protein BDP55DRAFT_565397 [Colletotrichum godetiae]|uniref:Zn(2)-C6 fungal-type domain-containing protein n=1 Tax=Colletotrichum godetiae TaxID=1209918 RepID=A0AAJ0AB15_9PEZI|nr:uncharacterized protein BDP55DRAFT_565397 [Colletotrichum godetiae]KAK1658297.1 hypothetical protein BDP55DRAFT_565397 [Colletotrichum godetiae]